MVWAFELSFPDKVLFIQYKDRCQTRVYGFVAIVIISTTMPILPRQIEGHIICIVTRYNFPSVPSRLLDSVIETTGSVSVNSQSSCL